MVEEEKWSRESNHLKAEFTRFWSVGEEKYAIREAGGFSFSYRSSSGAPSAKAPRAWFETVPSILHFPSSRKKATSDPSDNHPVLLASSHICLSCSNKPGVLMLHEEEKRHAWSGETRSSSFTMGERASRRERQILREAMRKPQ